MYQYLVERWFGFLFPYLLFLLLKDFSCVRNSRFLLSHLQEQMVSRVLIEHFNTIPYLRFGFQPTLLWDLLYYSVAYEISRHSESLEDFFTVFKRIGKPQSQAKLKLSIFCVCIWKMYDIFTLKNKILLLKWLINGIYSHNYPMDSI